MQYPFVPLDSIIAEVQAQLKVMNLQGLFIEDDAYSYAIEAAREIGCNNYDESTVGLPVRNHIGALPKDFYLVKEIWNITEPLTDIEKIMTVQSAFVLTTELQSRRTHLMRPGDSATVRLCKDLHTPYLSENTPTYWLRVPPGTIRASFREGTIGMTYYHLKKDERGVICIQDEVNTIRCVKAGITMNMLKEGFLMGKVAQYIYDRMENEYYTYLSQAQGSQKLPDPSTDKFHAEALRNRYNPFKL